MNKGMPNKAPIERNEYFITWFLSNVCNFKCAYCFNDIDYASDEAAAYRKYSLNHIARSFDNTGRAWHIQLTGGEPFLYPRFIEMCVLLTKKHRIGINTNLSTPNVYEFAKAVDPLKVYALHASWHLLERRKIDNGTKLFLDRVHCLQKNGFQVRIDYVTYPPLFNRIKKDIQFLKEEGIAQVYVKVFRGTFEGKVYPDSYNIHEKRLIKELASDQDELDILSKRYSFMGKRCAAGQRFFAMDEGGNLFRCTSALFPIRFQKERHGNIFEGDCLFAQKPDPCAYKVCICPYEGYDFVLTRRDR